jgi:hypothetical protein
MISSQDGTAAPVGIQWAYEASSHHPPRRGKALETAGHPLYCASPQSEAHQKKGGFANLLSPE